MIMSLKIAVVCSSNQNRSMETHHLLSKKGFNVKSYGTGSVVKLPGASANEPIVYPFGTTYEQMYEDLYLKDPHLFVISNIMHCFLVHRCHDNILLLLKYTQNGILRMLDRNRRIKPSPERFQDINDDIFDVVFTVEERIFDVVIEELESRGPSHYHPVHIINIDIQDNHDEATFGSFLFYEMCEMMSKADDLENEMEFILQEFEAKHSSRTILHSVIFC